jgi:hypothetical protein
MKKLLVALAAVLVATASYGQGTVAFDNLSLGVPIYDVGGVTGAGANAGAQAALYLKDAGGAYTLVPNSTTTFFGTSGEGAKYLSAISVAIPGVAPGASATLQVRAWAGASSYEAAVGNGSAKWGNSVDIVVPSLGGGGEPPGPPADMTAWTQSFTLVPEPSTIAFGVIGGLALLLRRRK